MAHSSKAGLEWTGHPFVDAGVAGLTVFAEKRDPAEVTEDDLSKFAKWAESSYFSKEMSGWIASVFTSNFVNYSFSPEKRKEVLKGILESYKEESNLTEKCTFFNRPASFYAARDLVPMLSGRGSASFYADGKPDLPLSGLAVTALQGLSLAAPLVGGRALVVAADDPSWTREIVQRWQPEMRKRAQLSVTTGKKGKIWSYPRTRLVSTLLDILRDQELTDYPGSVTIFHASNSGQGPDVKIYTLSAPVFAFLRRARNATHLAAWQSIESKMWTTKVRKDQEPAFATRNALYEGLFGLPRGAGRFLRRFFFQPCIDFLKKAKNSKEPEAHVQLWNLVEVFLEVILVMNKERIEAIRRLGDDLAESVASDNDRRLFRKIYEGRLPSHVGQLINQLDLKRLSRGKAPVVGLDDYLMIFFEGDELARADFYLAWDLTKIRVIEMLYEKKWFDGNKDVLAELDLGEDEE